MKRFVLFLLMIVPLAACQPGGAPPSPPPLENDMLLPREGEPDDMATDPLELEPGEGERLTITDLGVSIIGPADWEISGEVDNFIVGPPGGPTYLQVGLANGLNATDIGQIRANILTEVLNSGIRGVEARSESIGLKSMVLVSSEALDACQYIYIMGGTQVIAVRVAPALCDETGRLSETGFQMIRTMQLSAPTQ